MPTTRSAKKAMRQADKRKIQNYKVRSAIKETIKECLTLAKNKNAEELKKLLPKAFSIIDKAAKTYVLHKNNASRKKARLSALLAKLEKK